MFNDNKVPDIQENSDFIKNNYLCLNDKTACLLEVLPHSKSSDNDHTLHEDHEKLIC